MEKKIAISEKRAAVAAGPEANDPILDKDDIQGDILLGLTKTAEHFQFFEIKDVAAFKTALRKVARRWITSVSKVIADQKTIHDAKPAHGDAKPKLLPIRQANIAFSFTGLQKLGAPDADKMEDEFKAGAAKAAKRLNDPLTGNDPIWDDDFSEARIDGLLIVTGESDQAAKSHLAHIKAAFGPAIADVTRHEGKVREGSARGHEHFGFEDGISQPGIRGLTARENPDDTEQGVPGQDLLWPGEFVFGYPAQGVDKKEDPDPNRKQAPVSWMRDGAYMVFRKLEQAVPEFHAFVAASAEKNNMEKGILAARLVGRWPSGAPIVKAPLQDDLPLAGDRLNNNDFEFLTDDPDQRRCPYAAHIRKTYPRDDTGTNVADEKAEAQVQLHRLRRAGIPFGPETENKELAAKETAAGTSRGLSFVAYMTSIKDQFEFVQSAWANAPKFVSGKSRPNTNPKVPVDPGVDPIIGRAAAPGKFTVDEIVPNYPTGAQRSTLTFPNSFVTPRAAGYYFMPSLSALEDTLSK